MIASLIDALTSDNGIIAAIVVVAGLAIAAFNLRSSLADALWSRAVVALAAVELSELDPAARSRVLTFHVTNRGKRGAVVTSVRLAVAEHGESSVPRETQTMGGITVREHRVALEPGVPDYDVRAKLFAKDAPPISLGDGETEAFHVTLVSVQPQWYAARVVVSWYDIRRPQRDKTTSSSELRMDFPPSAEEARAAAPAAGPADPAA